MLERHDSLFPSSWGKTSPKLICPDVRLLPSSFAFLSIRAADDESTQTPYWWFRFAVFWAV